MTSISSLHSDHKNARKRTDQSAKLIEESLKRYGAARSIVIDEDNRILAGNGTIEGAKAAGIKNVRIIETDGTEVIAVKRTGLTEDEKVGLALADNRTSDLSDWDQEMLRRLSEEHDLQPWFEQEDLDELLAVTELPPEEGKTDPDDVPETPEDPITKPGDLWILGNHRLLCGDSTNPQHVERLMDGKKADMVFTDPPYGVSYTDSLGRSIKNDELTDGDLQEFLRDAFVSGVTVSASDCPWYVWHADRFTTEFVAALKEAGLRVRQQIIWVKGEGREGTAEVAAPAIGGSHYRFLHEPCWYASLGKPFNAGNRKTTTVWTVTRQTTGTVHPTQKPTDLIKIALENSSKAGQLILDLFGGSGSTLIACEQHHRKARLMELDPAYCDVIVKRWEDFTGNTAVCEPSSAHFQEELEV
jgi:site-specific DNA-methyltransferase (adenine-specific)